MHTQTKATQDKLTPKKVTSILKAGNARFVKNLKEQRNLKEQVGETSGGQYPYAVVLSCIDSRVPVELVFDQGIGDIFSTRVAGNIINEDVLGSIEYSCKVAGSKVVLVLGHTKCGAVTAACKGVELGNITALLSKINPAVAKVRKSRKIKAEMTASDIEETSIVNVKLSIARMKKESPILAKMAKKGEIDIIGGIYSVKTGKVTFL